MSLLPASSFDINWPINPAHYPVVFFVDLSWAYTDEYVFQPGSKTNPTLIGSTPLSHAVDNYVDNQYVHGEMTRLVVQSLARGLPSEYIILVSVERIVSLPGVQPPKNLPQALSRVKDQLKSGDLVVINVGFDGAGDSYARDEYVAQYLQNIADSRGGVVVISAGNSVNELLPTLAPDVVVAGGVDTTGIAQSRYGQYVTCYGVVPYDLPGYPGVKFGHSSAATAYTAGMVLMMLNYAKSNGLTLSSRQVVGLLKANCKVFSVLSSSGTVLAAGNIPDWDKLRPAIDVLAHGAN